jgi:hypothetical protein
MKCRECGQVGDWDIHRTFYEEVGNCYCGECGASGEFHAPENANWHYTTGAVHVPGILHEEEIERL